MNIHNKSHRRPPAPQPGAPLEFARSPGAGLARCGAQGGYTLLVVLFFASISLLVLGSALKWSMTNSHLNDRNNQYFSTAAAAEAATEKVLANVSRDFQAQGESLVWANVSSYRLLTPTTAESSTWSGFTFSDVAGTTNRMYVERLAASAYVPLQSQYQGIYGLASTYRVISNARMNGLPYDISTGVKQEVQLASIPIFQFAIFYSMDLEINPGPNMTITGRVHGNNNINLQPVSTLTFQSHVTAAGAIIQNKHTNDPSVRSLGSSQVIYQAEHDANTSALTLPVGTNNSPDAVQAIVEIPPSSEDPASPMGKQRFYNKADLVVLVSNTTVTVKSGLFNNFASTVTSGEWNQWLKTNVTFYNQREGKTIKTSELDVDKLRIWSASNTNLWPALGGRDVRSLYVADMRSQTGSTESGVRLKNGQTLPPLGLTVASPNPLYVQGHYNAPAFHLGTTNTSSTKPAALIGDSINLLSTAWNDGNGAAALSSRIAGDTTVNAAFMGGIVPSNGTSYSGGVENFPRFLEDWTSRTLAYNGSMVVMFYSKTSTNSWGGSGVYSPPIRQWTFDLNFLDVTKLPPCTPEVRALIRGQWAQIRPGTT
ncbi:MAG: hypothetical protein QOF48_709 [Verrucomicrobiota bacterium]|jgi:hypothetical protein